VDLLYSLLTSCSRAPCTKKCATNRSKWSLGVIGRCRRASPKYSVDRSSDNARAVRAEVNFSVSQRAALSKQRRRPAPVHVIVDLASPQRHDSQPLIRLRCWPIKHAAYHLPMF